MWWMRYIYIIRTLERVENNTFIRFPNPTEQQDIKESHTDSEWDSQWHNETFSVDMISYYLISSHFHKLCNTYVSTYQRAH